MYKTTLPTGTHLQTTFLKQNNIMKDEKFGMLSLFSKGERETFDTYYRKQRRKQARLALELNHGTRVSLIHISYVLIKELLVITNYSRSR